MIFISINMKSNHLSQRIESMVFDWFKNIINKTNINIIQDIKNLFNYNKTRNCQSNNAKSTIKN